MLIQKLLGRNRVEDYCFIQYHEGEEFKTTIALFLGHGYYQDLQTCKEVYFNEISNKELLIMYADINKKYISKKAALKFAKPYFAEFEADVLKYREELNEY